MWEKLPIIIHCAEFKNPERLQRSLRENLFAGLDPREQIRLAKDIYVDTSRFLACTSGTDISECAYCAQIIESQRKVAQEVLREISLDKT